MTEKKEMIILGIETSCDDTAVGIVTSGKRVLANVVYNQFKEHAPYGGVVPEIAARAHVDRLDELVKKALKEAGLSLADIDAFAATAGPGLVGGLMVGVVSAKTLSMATGKPFLGINHLEGHALSPRLVSETSFPYLLLLISGGHCQLLSVEGLGKYRRLGTTIDDAAGEAFDKGAKLLGLGVPGGPNLEKAAKHGNPKRFKLPRPLIRQQGCDFSFSGLKTALLREVEKTSDNSSDVNLVADLAASYQAAIADCLEDRTKNAMEDFKAGVDGPLNFVIAGGVAANALIRGKLEALSDAKGFSYFAPPVWLCTDNGAMIAWAGAERFRGKNGDPLNTGVRARWPLDENASPVIGHGRRGVKV
ncbi:MAG: tRNA (adenosine(37)-N6)-threonylcarbamoyltransferase complex transferase subunit TsaD [Sphingomonadales bacterium]